MIKKLTFLSILLFAIFIVSVGLYFYLAFTNKVSAIGISIDALSKNGLDVQMLNDISKNISGMLDVFIAQMIIFGIGILALLWLVWHLVELYLVQKTNAHVDALTNLYNKRAIVFGLKDEISRAVRYGHPLSIAMIDLDFFKKYNDANGHVLGDMLLKKLAKMLNKSIRDIDWVGRFGGEEFLIVFPETSLRKAVEVCERIRKRVESTSFKGQEKMPFGKITLSVGVAEFRGKTMIRRSRFIDIADKRLYRAKMSGRNRVVWDGE